MAIDKRGPVGVQNSPEQNEVAAKGGIDAKIEEIIKAGLARGGIPVDKLQNVQSLLRELKSAVAQENLQEMRGDAPLPPEVEKLLAKMEMEAGPEVRNAFHALYENPSLTGGK